jgi:hypothetical protein
LVIVATWTLTEGGALAKDAFRFEVTQRRRDREGLLR